MTKPEVIRTEQIFDRTAAVREYQRTGKPGDFRVPSKYDNYMPPKAVPADVAADRTRRPLFDSDQRRNKHLLRNWLFSGAIAIGGVGGAVVAGMAINERLQNIGGQESDLVTAASVQSDPRVTMYSGEYGDPVTIDGMIDRVDPSVPTDTDTFEQIYEQVAAQLNAGETVNTIRLGQEFQVPKVPITTSSNQTPK